MKRLTCTLVAVVGCTQPAETSAPSFDELVAAADRIDAAATKLETAAASLEATAKALEATRAELAARPPDPPPPPPTLPESREIPGASEAIVCPSEHKCTIKRGFIETAITEASLVRQ